MIPTGVLLKTFMEINMTNSIKNIDQAPTRKTQPTPAPAPTNPGTPSNPGQTQLNAAADTFNSGTTNPSENKTDLLHPEDKNKTKVFEFTVADDVHTKRKLQVKIPAKESPTEGAARQKLQAENPGMTIGDLVNTYEE